MSAAPGMELGDTATLSRVRKALDELARTGSLDFFYAHPVLESARWRAALRAADSTPQAQARIDTLERCLQILHDQPRRFGAGPVDALFQRVSQGEVTRAGALVLAADPELYWRVSPTYLRWLCTGAEHMALKGRWRDGVLVMQLVLALLDARAASVHMDQRQMVFIATLHWLDVVTRAVTELPDGRLFRDAVARGERLADIVHDPDGLLQPASLMHRLGVLYLDPYVAGRSNRNYERQIAEWQARFLVTLQAEHEIWDEATMAMPAATQALQRAAHWLDQAAAHRSGEARGWTLKALLQALVWLWATGQQPPQDTVQHIGQEALRLLDGPEHQHRRLEISNLLEWNADQLRQPRLPADRLPEDVMTLLSTPPAHWLDSMAPSDIVGLYLQASDVAAPVAPQAALALWDAVLDLAWTQGEDVRLRMGQHGLAAFARAYAPQPPPADAQTLSVALRTLKGSQAPDGATRAARLLGLVATAAGMDQEEQLLDIAQAVQVADENFAQRHAPFVALVRAHMLLSAAVNQVHAGQPGKAAKLYMLGAHAFARCGCPNTAFSILHRVMDLIEQGSDEALGSMVAVVGQVAIELEDVLSGAAESMQAIYRELMARLVAPGKGRPTEVVFLMEAAKGNAFAHALVGGTPLQWLGSPEALDMEQRIDELRSQLPAQPMAPRVLNDGLILSAYAAPTEQLGGATVQERWRNLQIAFDTEVSRALRAAGTAPAWIPSNAAVQAALGPRSALLMVYIGNAPDGAQALFLALLTQDSFTLDIGKVGFPSGVLIIENSNQKIALSLFGPMVAELRAAVQADPLLMRQVSASGVSKLQLAQEMFFSGSVARQLQALRAAGKDHLYIWPHGPFHFLPFHLIGSEGEPLAVQWNVTYLTNLHLLDPGRCHRSEQLQEFVAIGLDFPEADGLVLPALQGPEEEAQALVAAMGVGRALVGQKIDKATVLDALCSHRRVHIATHGELPVTAPSFQTLYLGTDGNAQALHAYEVLRLNLKGVDLVTLSACETSLGRFDVGDNLRGFSASLLIAGVSTIIGTLWPVESRCATFFFTGFYSALHAGASKGDAFRRAQLQTRRKFPQYRDWGTFYLTGAIS